MDVSITMRGKNADFLWQVVTEEGCTVALFPRHNDRHLGVATGCHRRWVQTPSDTYIHVATGGHIIDDFYTHITDRFCL
ncbi:hypothetical protein CI610_03102 [invertebrate metagenome]|uniref:Uncharacterized protein n=1 Tax=invertebrate metagenome TaxID=1711999 RepID=A0A2H9T408_9ZZZZ